MGIIMLAIHVTEFFPPEIIQNIAYVLLLLDTILFIVISKKSMQDMGLFRFRLIHQIIVIVGGISALIFGFWHYPTSHNIVLVFITFFTGAI
jgi:hypothetical protein